MKRKIYDELLSWKKDKQNTCLTIKGQRQVGKTYIVEQFGRENYEHFVEIDFSRMPQAELAFERGIDVDSVIRELSMRMDGTIIEPGNTLIFLDEIQECPKARASLKWFAQDGRYDVISSGSLLGVTNNNARRRKELSRMKGNFSIEQPVSSEIHSIDAKLYFGDLKLLAGDAFSVRADCSYKELIPEIRESDGKLTISQSEKVRRKQFPENIMCVVEITCPSGKAGGKRFSEIDLASIVGIV